jgi:carboxylate-amine ligase
MSGRAPFVLTWDAFKAYFDKMRATGVIESMKDFYWDIRPKPEFGTIEVRVMDTPLTVQRACDIAAYIQALARYLLLSRPFMPQEDDYLVYTFNRFQACRFGLEGEYVHPNELTRMPIADHILSICDALEPHAEALGSLEALSNIRALAASRATTRIGCAPPIAMRTACAIWCDRPASSGGLRRRCAEFAQRSTHAPCGTLSRRGR